MPEIGDIGRSKDTGRKGTNRCIWLACIDCGIERWVELKGGYASTLRCKPCNARRPEQRQKIREATSGVKSRWWKGGKYWGHGYLSLRVYPNDCFYPMVRRDGYVFEHRLVMAKHLGRCLEVGEIVHHKNGNKLDNSIGNLEIMTRVTHNSQGYKTGYKKGYADGFAKAMLHTGNLPTIQTL